MKKYVEKSVARRRADRARWRRRENWMPTFAASSYAKTHPIQARGIIAAIAAAIGRQMGRSRT